MVTVVVPVRVVIPGMIVFDTAMRTVPIASIELTVGTVRRYPVRALIRRPRPIARVPNIMVVRVRIPVSCDPNIRWSGARWPVFDPYRRWGTDVYSEGHLVGPYD